MKARDIMTASPSVVTPEDSVRHAAQVMREHDVGFVPVVEGRHTMRLVGVLTDRDLATRYIAEGRRSTELPVRDYMTRMPVATVGLEESVPQVVATMEQHRVRRVAVVDAAERVVGVIAQADLARKVGHQEPHVVEHLLERLSEPAHATV